jgi:hypothetical protein
MMFSAMRRRLRVNPATVVAGLALVFAMSGGAYAAKKYLITSTKQISPSVLKQLQGKAGPAGAPGAAGAQGVQGPAGPAGPAGSGGAKGETGPAGEKGASGGQGLQGKEGKAGATGPTGVSGFTETLPSGKTETGTWSFLLAPTEEDVENIIPISFSIPLAHAGDKAYFFFSEQVEEKEFGENKTTHASCVVGSAECVDTGCRWALENAEAKPEATIPGTLCVFEQFGSLPGLEAHFIRVTGGPADGYGPSGAYLFLLKKATRTEPRGMRAVGTWAVTAP